MTGRAISVLCDGIRKYAVALWIRVHIPMLGLNLAVQNGMVITHAVTQNQTRRFQILC